MHFNARSLVPNLDDLVLICNLLLPDIICIPESWLSPDICDNEVSLTSYICFCKDCSHCGGGVVIYVKSSYSVSVISSPSNLEFILISNSISKGNFPHSIGLFYRPPNNHSSLDNLIDFLSNLSYSHISNLILTSDFNINFLAPSPQLTNLFDLTNSIGLSQIIQEPTHFCHSGIPSTI